jgi:REP element-mobilizing transposase RayT
MARPLRLKVPGGWFHVTSRGNEKQAIYRDDDDRELFLRLLSGLHTRHRFEIHAYCLMGNHYHLLGRDLDEQLSRAIRHLNGVYAQEFNRRHDRVGHLFQGRFASSHVADDDYLVACAAYVHRNPVPLLRGDSLAGYRWSSYPAYVGAVRPPSWLATHELLNHHGSRHALRSFTEGGPPIAPQLGSSTPAPVIGSPTGRAEAVSGVAITEATRSSWRKALVQRCSIATIEGVVADVFGETTEGWRAAGSGRRSLAKMALIHLALHHAGHTTRELSEHLGFTSTSSVSKSSARLKALMAVDPSVREQVDRCWEQLVAAAGGGQPVSFRT